MENEETNINPEVEDQEVQQEYQNEDFGLDGSEDKSELNKKLSKTFSKRIRSINQKRSDAEARAVQAEAERDSIMKQHQELSDIMQSQNENKNKIDNENSKKMDAAINEGRLAAFHYKLNDAASQDSEFKDLLTNGNNIDHDKVNFLSKLTHIPNMPGVIKHLLKDKNDHAVFSSTTTPAEAITYINNISAKLNGDKKTSPSEYRATPELSSSPGASQFEAMDYLDRTGRGR